MRPFGGSLTADTPLDDVYPRTERDSCPQQAQSGRYRPGRAQVGDWVAIT